MPATIQIKDDESLATLVTIARMAHLAGNSNMEREAQEKLQEQYGIRLVFDLPARPSGMQRTRDTTPVPRIDVSDVLATAVEGRRRD
jgi:hypothetical protein